MNASAVTRIAITGVESTGKTTLTEALSARLGGVAVRECARYDAEVIAEKATLATLERLLTQPPVEDAGGLSEESAMFYRADFRLLTLVFASS